MGRAERYISDRELMKYFEQVDMWDDRPDVLGPTPSLRLIDTLSSHQNETGVYLLGEDWYYRPGSGRSVFLEDINPQATVVAHVHNRPSESGSIPSPHDFIHAPRGMDRHFALTFGWAARFWPLNLDVKGDTNDLQRYQRLYRLQARELWTNKQRIEAEVIVTMQREGCVWKVYPFEDYAKTDANLLQLLLYEN